MPGQEDQPSGENAFHIISFVCPSIFLPIAEIGMPTQGLTESRKATGGQGCSFLLIAARETQAAFC
jgi:hypothetical protein